MVAQSCPLAPVGGVGGRSRRAENSTFPPPTQAARRLSAGERLSEEDPFELAAAKPPRTSPEAEQRPTDFGRGRSAGGVTASLLARRLKGKCAELIGDSSETPRSEAGGRRRGRQVGPEAGSGERSGSEELPRQPFRESVRERWRAQSPTAPAASGRSRGMSHSA